MQRPETAKMVQETDGRLGRPAERGSGGESRAARLVSSTMGRRPSGDPVASSMTEPMKTESNEERKKKAGARGPGGQSKHRLTFAQEQRSRWTGGAG